MLSSCMLYHMSILKWWNKVCSAHKIPIRYCMLQMLQYQDYKDRTRAKLPPLPGRSHSTLKLAGWGEATPNSGTFDQGVCHKLPYWTKLYLKIKLRVVGMDNYGCAHNVLLTHLRGFIWVFLYFEFECFALLLWCTQHRVRSPPPYR